MTDASSPPEELAHPRHRFDAPRKEEVLAGALEVIDARVQEDEHLTPTSVNWHYTRACNYECKFCFHTAKSSYFLPAEPGGMDEAQLCLKRLRDAGMKKINFSGGEPFLHPKHLGELCRFCKETLKLESVSIVSNGSKIQERWFQQFGDYVDILAISCDSFNEETNVKIGRGKGMHIRQLEQVRNWCNMYGVPFKLNSVINIHNVGEDMTAAILQLSPVRWKVFQCLLLDGENAGPDALRDAKELAITGEQFGQFLKRHETVACLVPEDNTRMKDSYLISGRLRFLNCTGGAKAPSRSLREVSVRCALREAGFDRKMFVERGGVYAWSRARVPRPPAAPPDVEDLAAAGASQGGGGGEAAARGRPAVGSVGPRTETGRPPRALGGEGAALLTVAACGLALGSAAYLFWRRPGSCRAWTQ
ncbi:unnamed protein product [Prorocentrum cordatum]|uniref:Radical SAM core domain-containing protein n=2 Tax=Prorocentrum cordatum TaxID=2364126 RepID=A0ABN9W529_9DINO|nr:unnamed protein product [Polarella glacialis]